MSQHRFIRNHFNFDNEKIKITDRRLIHQILDVLRMDIGDIVTLSDGSLNEAKVEITQTSKKAILLDILEVRKNNNELDKDITLYCSILKNKNFDLVVQKCTEIGVKKIVPVISERTVKKGLKRKRLEKIIREAAEQSGRGIVPELDEITGFSQALEDSKQNEANIFFDLDEEEAGDLNIDKKSVGVFVGPEGGWSDKEIEQAKDSGLRSIKLSDLTYRAETAAIVGCYFC